MARVIVGCRTSSFDSAGILLHRQTKTGPTNPDRKGGGIAIYHRASLQVGKIGLQSAPEAFEALAVLVPFPDGPVTLITWIIETDSSVLQ